MHFAPFSFITLILVFNSSLLTFFYTHKFSLMAQDPFDWIIHRKIKCHGQIKYCMALDQGTAAGYCYGNTASWSPQDKRRWICFRCWGQRLNSSLCFQSGGIRSTHKLHAPCWPAPVWRMRLTVLVGTVCFLTSNLTFSHLYSAALIWPTVLGKKSNISVWIEVNRI